MDARYRIDHEHHYVEETFVGVVTHAKLVAFLTTVVADPAMQPTMNGVADFSEASIQLSFDEMGAFVGFLRGTPGTSRGTWALVAPQDLNFGMARMFQALSTDVQADVRVFRDRHDAVAWIEQLSRTD